MRITRVAAAAVLVLGLAGCSGSDGDDEPDGPPPTKKAADSGSDDGPPDVRGGVAAPDSLAEFECGPDDGGTWSASGKIDNAEPKKSDYRVTIVVAPASAASAEAREITLAGVKAGESEKFDTDKLPVTGGDAPTCTVQVARLDG